MSKVKSMNRTEIHFCSGDLDLDTHTCIAHVHTSYTVPLNSAENT